MTSREVLDRLEKVEHAIDLEFIHKPQAEVTGSIGAAAAQVIAALAETEQAVVQVGTLLIVKANPDGVRPTVLVRTLSMREMMVLERNPELMLHPLRLLKALEDVMRVTDTAILGDSQSS